MERGYSETLTVGRQKSAVNVTALEAGASLNLILTDGLQSLGEIMPALNVKRQFVTDIITGRKTQTFRPKGKRVYRVGQKLHLYSGLRSKQCELIKKTVIVSVTLIEFCVSCSLLDFIYIYNIPNALPMEEHEKHELAVADGFLSVKEFDIFFIQQYKLSPGDRKDMVLIKWMKN